MYGYLLTWWTVTIVFRMINTPGHVLSSGWPLLKRSGLTLIKVSQHAYLSCQAFSLFLVYHHVDFCNLMWLMWFLLMLNKILSESESAECRIRTHQGLRHQIASRLNASWQTDCAIEDQAKNLTSTARPYDQRAFSPLDPTAVWHSHLALAICMFVVVNFDAMAQASDIRIERRQVVFLCWIHTYIHTYLLLLISMLWHRQAIFKSKGDKLCSSAEGRIWTRGPRHQIASRLNARWQTDWAIEDQAKNLNSTARPYDQRAFSPLDPTVSWFSHLALAIYIFVVVNFDALAQASDIQIERRQVVFLCWMQDLNPGSQTPNTYIHTYIFIRGFALAQGTFLLVIFAWICYDGFESQLRNGYLLKCDCLFDCNWHIGTIKWETKTDILGWRDRGSNCRPRASRASALSITLHLIQLTWWFHKNFI